MPQIPDMPLLAEYEQLFPRAGNGTAPKGRVVTDQQFVVATAFLIVTPIVQSVAIATFFARVYTRARPTWRFEIADYIISVAFVCMTIMWALQYEAVIWAWGWNHPAIRPISSIQHSMKFGTIALPFWAWAAGSVKISIACMLLKFQQSRSWRYFVCAIIAINIALIGFMGIAGMFACVPYAATWDLMGKYKNTKHCWNRKVMLATIYVTCTCNVISDVTLSLVPLTFLGKVRRPLREKVVIGVLMALGVVASAFSIGRLTIQIRKDHFPDQSAVSILSGMLTCLEVQTSLIAACVPMLRSSANRWLSRIGLWRSSVGSSDRYPSEFTGGKGGSRRVMELNEVHGLATPTAPSFNWEIYDSAHDSGQYVMDPVTGRIVRASDLKEQSSASNLNDEWGSDPGPVMQDEWRAQRGIGYAR